MKRTRRCGVFLCTALLTATRPGVAQQGVAPGTPVIPWALLTDRPHLVDSALGSLHFPDILQSASVGGEVAVEVMVTATGRVDRTSIRVLRSTHVLFTNAVKGWMLDLRLTPPLRGKTPVATTMPLAVAFSLPARGDVPRRPTTETTIDSTGAHVVIGWIAVPRDSAAQLDSGQVPAVLRTMFVELVGPMRPEKGVAICLQANDVSAAAVQRELVSALQSIQPAVRGPSHCPPTYTSMILQLDARGNPLRRPPGTEDPIWVEIRNVESWTDNVYVATASTSQGTGGTDHFCTAQRDHADAPWRVSCEARRNWVSLR